MKKLITIIVALCSFNVFAGPGHKHGHHGHSHGKKAVNAKETKELAFAQIKRLVKEKKIDKSWESAVYEKSIRKKFGHHYEWVVTYNNDKGVKGKKLYIFLRLTGDYIAANFSGK